MLGMKNLLSTEECYVGSLADGVIKIGHYLDLSNDPSVLKDSIDFDNYLWTNEKGFLSKVLDEAKTKYHDKYGVYVTNIALVGEAYKNGETYRYGKLINHNENPLDLFTVGENTIIEAGINSNNEVVINVDNGNDGDSYNFKLYLITVSKLKRVFKHGKFNSIVPEDWDNLIRHSNAVTFKKERI